MNPYGLKRRGDEASSSLESPVKRRRSSRLDVTNNGSGNTGTGDGFSKAKDALEDELNIKDRVNAGVNTITPCFSNANPFDRDSGSGRGAGSAMALGGIPLNDIQLGVDPSIPQANWDRITTAMEQEILRQVENPPVLPQSQVPDLAPKARKIPLDTGAPGETPEAVELRNNGIAETNKAQDRIRNNMAAKKSRELRIEAVREGRRMLNEKEAEIAWYRLHILSTGGSVSGWDNMDPGVKSKIVDEVAKRVTEVDEARKEEAKTIQRAGRIAFQVWSILERKEKGEAMQAEDERMLGRYEAEIKLRRDALHRRRTGQPLQANDDELIFCFEDFLIQACLRESSGERDTNAREGSVERRVSLASPTVSRPTQMTSRHATAQATRPDNSGPASTVASIHAQPGITPPNVQQLWQQASMPYLQGATTNMTLPTAPIVSMSGQTSGIAMPAMNISDDQQVIGTQAGTPSMGVRDLNIQQPATTLAGSSDFKPQIGYMSNDSGILNPYGLPSTFDAAQAFQLPQTSQAPQAIPDPQNWAYMSSSAGKVPDQFIDPSLIQDGLDLPSSAMQGHDDFLGSLAGPEDWQANPFSDKDYL